MMLLTSKKKELDLVHQSNEDLTRQVQMGEFSEKWWHRLQVGLTESCWGLTHKQTSCHPIAMALKAKQEHKQYLKVGIFLRFAFD